MRRSQIFWFLLVHFVPKLPSAVSDQCGQPPIFSSVAGLVLGGAATEKNKYPFLASLFNTDSESFFCGGTLISSNHIITAAHCFQTKKSAAKLATNKVVAFLGKYELYSNDRFVYPAYPSEIITHDDWNPHDPVYDADIAILHFYEPITFRVNVYPACLWSSDGGKDDGNHVIMVGYGTSEHQEIDEHENIPREARISLVSNDECGKNPRLRRLISHRTVCGAGKGEASPCRGDSGSGLYIKKNDRWFLRALVSSSLVNDDNSCDKDNYAIFTDITKFRLWIRRILGMTLKLKCEFQEQDRYYSCQAKDLKIDKRNTVFTEVTGAHSSDRNNADVSDLNIVDQSVSVLPIEMGALFPNLFCYFVKNSGLKEVESNNFAGLRKLAKLEISINQVEELPRDLFFDLKRLRELYLDRNRIKALHRDLFINNPNLETIYIYSNQIEVLDSGLFRNNPNLFQLHIDKNQLREIGVQFFDPIPFLELVNFQHNVCINAAYPKTWTLSKLKDYISRNCQSRI